MSSTKTYTFDNEDDFNFVETIEIDDSAKLIKFPTPEIDVDEDFSSDEGFIYDSDDVEFDAGTLQQIDQTEDDHRLAIKYFDSLDASWNKDASTTGIAIGSPIFNNGGLECIGDNGGRINCVYGRVGTIKFMYRPEYTGNPSLIYTLWTFRPTSGTASALVMQHRTDSRFRFISYDTDGIGTIFNTDVSQMNAESWYEIEVDWNTVTGTFNVYVKGVPLSNDSEDFPITFAESTTGFLEVGRSGLVSNTSNGTFKDVYLYNAQQHVASYTEGYDFIYSIYNASTVVLPALCHNGGAELLSIDSVTITDSGSPTYTYQGKHWNGSAWVASSGASESNSSSVIAANIASLDLDEDETEINIVIYFPASNTISTVSNIANEVTSNLYSTENPIVSVKNANRFWSSEITAIDIDVVESGLNIVKGIMSLDGVKKYWTGAEWATSNGTYTQANTIAEIETNIATLLTERVVVGLEFFLHSETGTFTPEINFVTISHDAALPDPVPRLVDLNGFIYDCTSPIENEEIKVRPYIQGHNGASGVFHKYVYKTIATTLADGFFSGSVIIQTSTYEWEIKIGKQSYRFTLPDQDSVDLNDLTLTLVD